MYILGTNAYHGGASACLIKDGQFEILMVAIRCEGISKQYRIGKRERHRALRDVLTDGLSAPFRRLRNSKFFSVIRNSSGL